MHLFKNLPKKEITLVWPSNSVAIKKGNKAGTTDLAHSSRPTFAACKLLLEKITRKIVNKTNNTEIKLFFNFFNIRTTFLMKFCFNVNFMKRVVEDADPYKKI